MNKMIKEISKSVLPLAFALLALLAGGCSKDDDPAPSLPGEEMVAHIKSMVLDENGEILFGKSPAVPGLYAAIADNAGVARQWCEELIIGKWDGKDRKVTLSDDLGFVELKTSDVPEGVWCRVVFNVSGIPHFTLLLATSEYCENTNTPAKKLKVGSSAGEWGQDGDGELVKSKVIMVRYTAGDLKRGDYIYQDGTTSDGGLRRIYTDGSIMSLTGDKKPEPEHGKTVVGIVCWTPSESPGSSPLKDDKIMTADFPGCTHGLAVALRNASFGGSETMVWQNPYEFVKDFQNGENFTHANKADFVSISSNRFAADNINRIYGYQNTVILRAYNAYCRSKGKSDYIVRPLDAIDEFKAGNPAPANSTDWFLPSVKDLYILFSRDVWDIWDSSGRKLATPRTLDVVNSSLAAAGGDVFATENAQLTYWSSTEDNTVSDAYLVRPWDAGVFTQMKDRDRLHVQHARAMCAF